MWIIFLVWFLIIVVVSLIILGAARVAVVLGALPKKWDEIIGAPLPQKEKFQRKSNLPRIAGTEIRISPQQRTSRTSSHRTANQSEVHIRSSVVEVKGMKKRRSPYESSSQQPQQSQKPQKS